MGTKTGMGDIIVIKSKDKGKTWTKPVDRKTGLLLKGRFHTAPVPVVVHNNRIWRAYEESPDSKNPRHFHAFVISADINADLLNASSWTKSNGVLFDKSWINAEKPEWCEGNVVVTPEGKIANIIRMKSDQEKGGTFKIKQDGKNIENRNIIFNPIYVQFTFLWTNSHLAVCTPRTIKWKRSCTRSYNN